MSFSWDEATIERARALAVDGKSASQIADVIGTSRGSVIGKHHRVGLGLASPQDGARRFCRAAGFKEPRTSGGGMLRRITTKQRKPRALEELPAFLPSSVEIIGPLAGRDVPGRLECRWIEGEMGQGGRYCGQPVHELTSYCPHHTVRMYVPEHRQANRRNWRAA